MSLFDWVRSTHASVSSATPCLAYDAVFIHLDFLSCQDSNDTPPTLKTLGPNFKDIKPDIQTQKFPKCEIHKLAHNKEALLIAAGNTPDQELFEHLKKTQHIVFTHMFYCN